MKKLLQGIIEFRQKHQAAYREKYARLAARQEPKTLMVACSDSRVTPHNFASTDPGDMFVVRNVGNLIPPCERAGEQPRDESEAAAIEFALEHLKVEDIVICGHSECGAVAAMLAGRENLAEPHLRDWIQYAETAQTQLAKKDIQFDSNLSELNQASQANVIAQVEHLQSYPLVQEALQGGRLRLHAWWYDLAQADVYHFDNRQQKFVLIDESCVV